jgi:hypothetical protein
MRITELKKHLSNASKEELTKQIADLFKKNDFVKNYYKSKFESKDKFAVLDKYKETIKNEFFPKRGYGKARLSVAKKSISEFKKLSSDNIQIAELMLYYVEMGVEFTNSYGDIDENFYISMESMYEQVNRLIVKEDLVDEFYDRCYDVVTKTSGIGWGFHDQLTATFDVYLSDKNT